MTHDRLKIENTELRKENAQLRKQLAEGIECDHSPLEQQIADQAEYITKLQRHNSQKIDRVFALVQGYQEAIEDIRSWAVYATDYFQHKHDLKGCIARHEQIIRKGGLSHKGRKPDAG
jgi:hypothetical protein